MTTRATDLAPQPPDPQTLTEARSVPPIPGAPKSNWLTRLRTALGLHNPLIDPTPRAPLPRRILRFFNPLTLAASIPGPIFQKEVWISGRKAGTYWGRFLYALGMLGLVTLVFVTTSAENRASGRAQLLQQMQTIAPAIFTAVIIFQFLALALAGCILGAPTICEEKRAGTLGALLTTPLKAWQIVLGKTSAFFIQILILTLIATPLLLAIRVFGGLSAEVVLASVCLALSTSLLAGILGLYNSIGVKRSPSAILGALVSLIASQAVLPLIVMYIKWRVRPISLYIPAYACAPWALGFQIGNEMGAMLPTTLVRNAWLSSTAYNLVLAALAMWVSAWRLRRAMAREAEGGSIIPKGKKAKKGSPAPAPDAADDAGTDPASGHAGLPAPRKKKRTIHHPGTTREVGDRPVLWRELRQSTFRTRNQLIITSVVFLFILGVLYWKVGLDEEGLHYSVAIIATLGVACIAAVGTTAGISGERESRTWEALLATPLSARQIVLGKFLGAIRRQWFVPAVAAIHFTAAAIYNGVTHEGFPAGSTVYIAVILSAPIIALSGTGVLFSLLFRKSTVAAVCNFGLALLVWLVIPVMYIVFTEIVGRYSATQTGLSVMSLINPVPMMVQVMRHGLEGRYDLFDWRSIGPITFNFAMAGYWIVLTGIGLGSARLAATILANRTGRRV